MAAFVTQVPVRWTDVDPYQHLNHARAVTLMEEARIELFFHEAVREGADGFAAGLFVVSLHVDYKRQIAYASRTLRMGLTIDAVGAASFTVHYALQAGPEVDDPVAVRGSTRMAVFDTEAQKPRRMLEHEREFLHRYAAEVAA